jgi:hypothetical protein
MLNQRVRFKLKLGASGISSGSSRPTAVNGGAEMIAGYRTVADAGLALPRYKS